MFEGIAAIVAALITAFVTWLATKTQYGRQNTVLANNLNNEIEKVKTVRAELAKANQDHRLALNKMNSDHRAELYKARNELSAANSELIELRTVRDKFESVRKELATSEVVRNYSQPVLLLGPKFVGKTSLLMQWHAPWDRSEVSATRRHRVNSVPVYSFKLPSAEPHFADPEIYTAVQMNLRLRVHDFPGELSGQESAAYHAREETASLKERTKKNLGVVLICMFDASEVNDRTPSSSTIEYYNGSLFDSLRDLSRSGQVHVERIVLVFNKYDLMQERLQDSSKTDAELMKMCLKFFDSLIEPLRGVCHQELFCETFTILDRGQMLYNNRGAPIVLGEAARSIVSLMAGSEAADRFIRDLPADDGFQSSAPRSE